MLTKQGEIWLIGDASGVPSEGYKIPNLSKLASSSENSKKPEMFKGHLYGAIGMAAGTLSQNFVLPLYIWIANGWNSVREWAIDVEIKEEAGYCDPDIGHPVDRIRRMFFCTASPGVEKAVMIFDRGYMGMTVFIACAEILMGLAPGSLSKSMSPEYEFSEEEKQEPARGYLPEGQASKKLLIDRIRLWQKKEKVSTHRFRKPLPDWKNTLKK